MTDKTYEILGILLSTSPAEAAKASMETCPAWDSMKHIEIIMTLEDELGISFDPQDIPTLVSAEKIAKKIKEIS